MVLQKAENGGDGMWFFSGKEGFAMVLKPKAWMPIPKFEEAL